jgi:hypothetical protein
MLLSGKFESPQRTPTAAALDAGATIQDALVRRLRLARAVSDDAGARQVVEDRAPIAAVLGRRR